MSIEDTVRQIAICRDEISRLSKVLCDRGASSKVKDLVHEEYHNLEQELRRLTTQWTNELTERERRIKMKTYYVKVEATLYYDRNYEIEADDELKAGEIAEELAEREFNDYGNDVNFRRDWEFGHVMHETIYAEESD